MTSTDTQPQAIEAKDVQHSAKKLYETQIEQFRKLAGDESLEAALERYGFALFHSMTPEQQILAKEEMGIKCRDAADFYNLGLAHASTENYAKAISAWNQALKLDAELSDAQFNLALANEKAGNASAARAAYKKYIDSIDDADEIQRVKDHLAEIGD